MLAPIMIVGCAARLAGAAPPPTSAAWSTSRPTGADICPSDPAAAVEAAPGVPGSTESATWAAVSPPAIDRAAAGTSQTPDRGASVAPLAATAFVPAGAPADGIAPAIAPAPTAHHAAWAIGADRFQHASLSFALGSGIGIATREPAIALGGAIACGVAKELWDMRSTRFDPLDLAADAVGAVLAAALIGSLAR